MLMNKQIIMRMLISNINNIESINQIKFCNFRTDIYTLGIMVQWCSISYISYFLYIFKYLFQRDSNDNLGRFL